MRHVPELQQLAQRVSGDPPAALRRLLVLVCELLAMDAAWVAFLTQDGRCSVQVAVHADGTEAADLMGAPPSLTQTWCGHLLDEGLLLVADVAGRPDLEVPGGTAVAGVVSAAGVVLRDEAGPIGTLCAVSYQPHPSLNARDGDVLRGLAQVVSPLLRALRDPVPVPQPRGAPDLSAVAAAVAAARDVEQLSRPLLDALHDLTGLASSYLTVIHPDQALQEIRYARNTREGFELPEGLSVPWADTLCKRALEEGRPCTTNVPDVWGDSQAAAALGIQVYVSVPVNLADGRVWGTLCAADDRQAMQVDEHLPTMRLFAKLIASQVDQEAAVASERALTAQARADADLDPLTRCATRRVVQPWLIENLAALAAHEVVLAVYVDVDRFKVVNDLWGHAAGDAILTEVGLRLHTLAQPGDLVARLGGDEFLVAARLPRAIAPVVADRYRAGRMLSVPWNDEVLLATLSVGTALSDGHDAAALVAAADRAMYTAKRTEPAAG